MHVIRALLALLLALGLMAAGAGPVARATSPFEDRWVPRGDHRIHVREQLGTKPAIVLMHGFPDDHHLYDELVPLLAGRHVVVFDFLGWGESDKPSGFDYSFANQTGDLDAVIAGLGLEDVVLVPHDAAGPAAFNWALDHRDRVDSIVALNLFFSLVPLDMPNPYVPGFGPNPPEFIRLFSDPAFEQIGTLFSSSPNEFRWLFESQVGGLIDDDALRAHYVPLFYEQFAADPSTLGPFLALTADLRNAVLADTQRNGELGRFPAPVRFVFGDRDPYLSSAYAEALAALFGHGEVATIHGVGHYPQIEAPAAVAEQILIDTVT